MPNEPNSWAFAQAVKSAEVHDFAFVNHVVGGKDGRRPQRKMQRVSSWARPEVLASARKQAKRFGWSFSGLLDFALRLAQTQTKPRNPPPWYWIKKKRVRNQP